MSQSTDSQPSSPRHLIDQARHERHAQMKLLQLDTESIVQQEVHLQAVEEAHQQAEQAVAEAQEALELQLTLSQENICAKIDDPPQSPTKLSRVFTPVTPTRNHAKSIPATPNQKVHFRSSTEPSEGSDDGTETPEFHLGAVYTPVRSQTPSPPPYSRKRVQKLWVVYWGRNNCDGIFDSWYGDDGAAAATE
ncbi:hypothetical protein GYMLUDRAFT_238951 [Collybiopsis luxurians FD-317 M1]|nr:hypothetical protein GYMLUDRAFT_238951 [Collybiopsis luxurians FD-317 M1]